MSYWLSCKLSSLVFYNLFINLSLKYNLYLKSHFYVFLNEIVWLKKINLKYQIPKIIISVKYLQIIEPSVNVINFKPIFNHKQNDNVLYFFESKILFYSVNKESHLILYFDSKHFKNLNLFSKWICPISLISIRKYKMNLNFFVIIILNINFSLL